MLEIYIDADGCPVKEETYRVAGRYGLKVWLVANHWLRAPESPLIEKVVVEEGLDRADDWIAARAGTGDIVITSDVPLADRCVKAGARVISGTGKVFSESSIGSDLALRNLMTSLRETGEIRGGGRPMDKRDRSRFLQELDKAVQAIRRTGR
ncbi:MAG: YaiI/YqxD family protein [Geminicoccaceae bacterium]|nr:YaiI/YqxD family protein [Geminicoccaceae bacterium]